MTSALEDDCCISAGSEDENYEDDLLAQLLEADDEVLVQDVNQDSHNLNQENFTSSPSKKICLGKEWKGEVAADDCTEIVHYPDKRQNVKASRSHCGGLEPKSSIDSGPFSKIPSELYPNIFKFLSPVDLGNCTLVCKFMRVSASDEFLWRRLYCMRWGSPLPDHGKLQICGWKKLYFEHDSADMIEFVRDSPKEFQEYFIQMQAAKRNDAPDPSKFKEDLMIPGTTAADQINQWKQSRGLPDVFMGDHVCSGSTCTYSQAGDFFLCEKTGNVHVCDHTCRETVYDALNQLLVCTISGRCSEWWVSTSEEEVDPGHQHADNSAGDEAEPLTRAGQLARAYWLGYNCNDERELEVAVREVLYPGSNGI